MNYDIMYIILGLFVSYIYLMYLIFVFMCADVFVIFEYFL